MADLIDRTLVDRLPLPVAQLRVCAANANSPMDAHQSAFFLGDMIVRLLGAVAVVEYSHAAESRSRDRPRVAEPLTPDARSLAAARSHDYALDGALAATMGSRSPPMLEARLDPKSPEQLLPDSI